MQSMSDTKKEVPSGRRLSALDPIYRDAPHTYLDQLRREDPVHNDREFDRVVLTRAVDIEAVLNDRSLCKDPRKSRQGSYSRVIEKVDENYKPGMLFADDPDHKRLRGLVTKAFSHNAMEAMRPQIIEAANRLLDEIPNPGNFDVIQGYADPLPTIVIALMLGVDRRDLAKFKEWSDCHSSVFNPLRTEEQSASLERGRNGLTQYFAEVVQDRRENRGTDLISNLISAEENDQRLKGEEIIGICYLLLLAGNLTTTDLIGNGVLALLRHPDQLAKMKANPKLASDVVEEVLRYDSPVSHASRVTPCPMVMDGVAVEEGQTISALLLAANYDPSAHPDPFAFDIERPDKRHSSFGGGSHYCLGAPLARVEAQVALPLLFDRFPKLRLAEEHVPKRKAQPSFNGLESLWLET
jgi:cytochrome P450